MTESQTPVSIETCEALFAALEGYRRVAVAVSGGPDSVALLYLLKRWRDSGASRPEITALTVDHGLRAQSAAEAASVAQIASALRVAHETLTWSPPEGLRSGIQALARQARYDLMAAYCHGNGIEALLTAHHLNDQAETFLMRLNRGSGLDGLAAIPQRGDWAGITLFRPLLDIPKSRLIATAEAAGLAYAEDVSNRDLRFERARLRKTQTALEALGVRPEAIGRSAKRLTRARAALDQATEGFLVEAARLSPAGSAEIDLAALLSAPEDIALRALQRLLAMAGGRPAPLRLAKLEALLEALRAEPEQPRSLGGCRLVPGTGRLLIVREMRRHAIPELTLRPGELALWDNRFVVSLAELADGPATVRALGSDGAREAAKSASWLRDIPPPARASLPSCWRNQALLSVSCRGLEPEAVSGDAEFSARFVHAPG